MLDFYTHVFATPRAILVRGVDDAGEPFTGKFERRTRAFVAVPEDTDTKWRTMDGKKLVEKKYAQYAHFLADRNQYSDLLYGTSSGESDWISEAFPITKDIVWDIDKINISFIDIETEIGGFPKYDDTHTIKFREQTGIESELTLSQFKKLPDFQSLDVWDELKLVWATLDKTVYVERTPGGFPNIDEADQEITAITTYSTKTKRFLVYGTGDFDTGAAVDEQIKALMTSVTYFKCKDEAQLLALFLRDWAKDYPDVMSDWNGMLFDVPYLVNRINRILGENSANKLSPWGVIRKSEKFLNNKNNTVYKIVGINHLDYLPLYKKFNPVRQASYRLDHIADVELGQKKLDYKEYDNLHTLYKRNYQRFIEYNIQDVNLLVRLEEKKKFLYLALMIAYQGRINSEDAFSPILFWESYIFNTLKSENILPPFGTYDSTDSEVTEALSFLDMLNGGTEKDEDESISGGFVKNVRPGGYSWIVSYDLNSLYPNVISQQNISPETLIEPYQAPDDLKHMQHGFDINANVEALADKAVDLSVLKKHDITMTPNFQLFRKDRRGIVPRLMDQMYQQRASIKRGMLDKKRELIALKHEKHRREQEKK